MKNWKKFFGMMGALICALAANATEFKSTPGIVAELEYFYAKDGTITGRRVNAAIQMFSYDKRGQLIAVVDAQTGRPLERYVYDPAGNILSKTVNGKTTTFTYDKANQLVSSTLDGKTTDYRYDGAGRLVKEGDKTYQYGYLDKILNVLENGENIAGFDYHMDGQIASSITKDGAENFLWDGLALIHRGDTNYINEPAITGGNPVLAGDNVLFNDMLGTTLGVKSGEGFNQIAMTAFGESESKDAFFTGKPIVGEIGYVFLFRAYRADQGKWQTEDPIGYPDGWNNFAYVNNNVIAAYDPVGQCTYFLGILISRCDVDESSTQTVAGEEVPYCQLTCGCSSGVGAKTPEGSSLTLSVQGNISLWGLTIPVNFSWNWTSPKEEISAYVCSSSTHTANGGEKSVLFYATPYTKFKITKYKCGEIVTEEIAHWENTGNRTVVLTNCKE